MPAWAVRWISRLYISSDALGELVLRLGTRVFLAVAIAGGAGFAAWPVPFTGDSGTAPLWTLLLCWTLLFGLATRPVALILSAVAPIALSSSIPDRFEVALPLLLLAAKGVGRFVARWRGYVLGRRRLRMPAAVALDPPFTEGRGWVGMVITIATEPWGMQNIHMLERSLLGRAVNSGLGRFALRARSQSGCFPKTGFLALRCPGM